MRNRHGLLLSFFLAQVVPLVLVVGALCLTCTPLACGGSSSSDVATPFVGDWTFDTGMVNATCTGGLPNGMFPLAGLTGTITRVNNTQIMLTANASCVINFNVSGTTATAASGQTCTLNTPTLGPQQIDITSWTLTMSGATLATSIMGTAVGGLCNAAGTGTLSKHAATDGGTD